MTASRFHDPNEPNPGAFLLASTDEICSEELAASEARFRATFDNAAVGIAHVDLDGKWLWLNRKYTEILGHAPAALAKLRFQDVTHHHDLRRETALARELLAGKIGTYTLEKRYVRKDGDVVWVELTVSLVRDQHDRPLHFIAVATDIDRRKRAEGDLRLSEQRLRLALEATELAAWDWNLVTGEFVWSDAVKALFGFEPERSIVQETFFSRIPPEDRKGHRESIRQAMDPKSGGQLIRDFRIIRANDGQERWLSTRARTTFDEHGRAVRMLGMALDVTEQKRRDARLRFEVQAGAVLGSSLVYQATLDRVAKLVVPEIADWCTVDIAGPDGTLAEHAAIVHQDAVKIASVQACRRRFPPRPGSNAPIVKAIETRETQWLSGIDDTMLGDLAESSAHFELLRSLHLHCYAAVPLTAGEQTFGAVSFAMAESGRSFSEEDILLFEAFARSAARAIENARLHKKTQEAIALRDKVLAIVSHDLRNPLQVVGMASTLLRQNPAIANDAAAHKQLETLTRSAVRMEVLIADLLDLSSIQAGHLSIVPSACDLGTLLDEAAEFHESLARHRGVTLKRSPSLGDARTVSCDRLRILQLLSNLLTNAVKFCRPGDTITLGAEPRHGEVWIFVRDTGPGIEAQDLPHVFEIYWKTDRDPGSGTGLGLSIARGIVQAHGGHIWVESETGAGTVFTFTLPEEP